MKLQKLYQHIPLTHQQYNNLPQILATDPNFTELAIFSVMCTEHCS
ncbi:hypothetical protein, partial [Staphylococcus hominis]